MMNALERG
jgi:hypothetical protein